MSGRRLWTFRQGDRSEYLAMFGLSRIAFVNPVPRQEDFGVVDFSCILNRRHDGSVIPENEFYVQVKSTKDDVVFDENALQWIAFHMEHPLLICVVDKKSQHLSFYSCAPLWGPIFNYRDLPPRKVALKLDTNMPINAASLCSPPEDREWTVPLGQPILRMCIADLETNDQIAANIIRSWISFDSANIAMRRIGRISTMMINAWSTNELLPNPASCLMFAYFGPHFSLAERDLFPILVALLHNYRDAVAKGNAAVLSRLEALFAFLSEFQSELKSLGVDLDKLRTETIRDH